MWNDLLYLVRLLCSGSKVGRAAVQHLASVQQIATLEATRYPQYKV